MPEDARVVNLSSAAQSPVDLNALKTFTGLTAGEAYAQSKLALTMWSMELALHNPLKVIVAVNPKSFLGSKMVKDAYGMEGHDLRIGADILTRASLSDEFKDANGLYFDNDKGAFSNPYPTAMNQTKRQKVIEALEDILR